MIRYFILFLVGLNSVCAHQYPVQLGDSVVIIKQFRHGKGKAFVHLHQNETTALKAAKMVIRAEGGSVLTLVHAGQRNISFKLHQHYYEFDPNRIFTDMGIKKTLAQYSHYSVEGAKEVKKLADAIKAHLSKGKVIAVHNNESYSLKNYFPGHDMAEDAQALHVNKDSYHRNFYLVTREQDYLRLKEQNFNSIWQALNATDDGSLSVYLADSEYINVEAGYDQLAMQVDMLKRA